MPSTDLTPDPDKPGIAPPPKADWDKQPACARSLTKQPGIAIKTKTYTGSYTKLEAFALSLSIGYEFYPDGDGIDNDRGWYVSAVECHRTRGNRGTLSVTLTKHEEKEQWGLEMTEIQKPIINWKADATSTEKPNITQIRAWQALEAVDKKSYDSFKYDGKTKMTGNTLKLAQMIFRGVESFPVYAPVITRTTRTTKIPFGPGTGLGIVAPPQATSGDAPSTDAVSALISAANEWLKTEDRIVGALDGTYTRTEAWTGANKWDQDLYTGGSGGGPLPDSGGSDSGGSGSDSGSGGLGPNPDLGKPDLGPNPEL